jgi:hypothetical protein
MIKTGSNRFDSIFLFWLEFFRFGLVFSVWRGFVPVWLGFFLFFFDLDLVWFFWLFFFLFSRFNQFFGFFFTPSFYLL